MNYSWGHAEEQLFETTRYKPEGRGFDSRRYHNPSDFTMVLGSTQPHNRNEYQEYFLGGKGGQFVELTTLPPSCASCLEMCVLQLPGNLRICPGLDKSITFFMI
jgi:hypothetical protein